MLLFPSLAHYCDLLLRLLRFSVWDYDRHLRVFDCHKVHCRLHLRRLARHARVKHFVCPPLREVRAIIVLVPGESSLGNLDRVLHAEPLSRFLLRQLFLLFNAASDRDRKGGSQFACLQHPLQILQCCIRLLGDHCSVTHEDSIVGSSILMGRVVHSREIAAD